MAIVTSVRAWHDTVALSPVVLLDEPWRLGLRPVNKSVMSRHALSFGGVNKVASERQRLAGLTRKPSVQHATTVDR